MEPDETEVQCAPAKLRGTHGILTLTNRRLLFTHTLGTASRKGSTVLDLPLSTIKDVWVDHNLVRSRVVLVAQGEGHSGESRIEIEVHMPDKWRSMIESQIPKRHAETEEEGRKNSI
jgi:hypothetical protein